jgi:peptidyl-prolyl cis-trans isomerase SurA
MVAVLVVIIGMGVAPSVCTAELIDRIAAVVNDDIILLSELDQAMAPVRMQLEKAGYPDVERNIILENQKQIALKGLIDQKLTDQQIKRYGISVSDEQVDKSIERIKAVNNMTDADLERVLKMEGLSYDAYRKQIRTQMLQSRLINIEVKSKIVVTDQDIKAYYDGNHAQYAGQTKYHLRQLLLRIDSPLDAERERVRRQMAAIEEQLKKGASFVELAKTHSQAATAADGGDLGFFEARLLAAPIREALSGLKAGQFTSIVETDQGYQIFYVDEISSTGRSLEQASREIEDKLVAEAREKKFQAWLEELRQRAHIEILN